MEALKRFVLFLGVITLLAMIASVFFKWLAPAHMVSSVLLFIPLFYFVILFFSKLILQHVSSKDDRKFTQTFLAISVFRFLLYLAVLIAYSLLFPNDAVRFIISFFVFYFLFTVFEISYLYRDLHPRKN
ncbi:MAG: hypothetical protein K0B09_09000 [Bacteroidales bacterium]|nr:hypothetical protein [Bacteroidales bacterium]